MTRRTISVLPGAGHQKQYHNCVIQHTEGQCKARPDACGSVTDRDNLVVFLQGCCSRKERRGMSIVSEAEKDEVYGRYFW